MMQYLNNDKKDTKFLKALALLSPGTSLREGIEYILHGGFGGLIVIGDSPEILDAVGGGFPLDCDFWPTRLYELAKMDGAIILSSDLKLILYANAYIRPNLSIPTHETGMRHQAAERLAKQTGAMVLAISKRRSTLTIFLGNRKYVLRDLTHLITGANQTLLALERYVTGLNMALNILDRTEFSGMVTLMEVTSAIQRTEMVRRTENELNRYRIELGSEGQSLQLHYPQLGSEVKEGLLTIRDYYRKEQRTEAEAFERISKLNPEQLSDGSHISVALGYSRDVSSYTEPLIPRGYRILNQIPRLPPVIVDNLMNKFHNLQTILEATIEELQNVEGVGEIRATMIKDELAAIKVHRYV